MNVGILILFMLRIFILYLIMGFAVVAGQTQSIGTLYLGIFLMFCYLVVLFPIYTRPPPTNDEE